MFKLAKILYLNFWIFLQGDVKSKVTYERAPNIKIQDIRNPLVYTNSGQCCCELSLNSHGDRMFAKSSLNVAKEKGIDCHWVWAIKVFRWNHDWYLYVWFICWWKAGLSVSFASAIHSVLCFLNTLFWNEGLWLIHTSIFAVWKVCYRRETYCIN